MSGSKNVTDRAMHTLADQDKLSFLDLSGCVKLTDRTLELLAHLPITHLDLSGCQNITDDGLKHLQDMPLKLLDLSGCKKITNEGLRAIKDIPLTTLFLDGQPEISDIGIMQLASMPLEEIAFCSLHITDVALWHMRHFSLRSLDLAGCDRVTNQGLEYLQIQGHSFHYLNLDRCSIDDDGLVHLRRYDLQYLNLAQCNITDEGLAHLKGQSKLDRLTLSYCEKIVGYGFKYLQDLPLQFLGLNNGVKIANKHLQHLLCLPLNELVLNGCVQVTNEGVEQLVTLPLKKLSLLRCPLVATDINTKFGNVKVAVSKPKADKPYTMRRVTKW